jgi:hypothetical protein
MGWSNESGSSPPRSRGTTANGKDFCKEVARAAGAAIQTAAKMSLAVGYIDEWEGDLFIFDSDGNPTTRYVQPQ